MSWGLKLLLPQLQDARPAGRIECKPARYPMLWLLCSCSLSLSFDVRSECCSAGVYIPHLITADAFAALTRVRVMTELSETSPPRLSGLFDTGRWELCLLGLAEEIMAPCKALLGVTVHFDSGGGDNLVISKGGGL